MIRFIGFEGNLAGSSAAKQGIAKKVKKKAAKIIVFR
jgi:hypothetical protein